MKRRARTESAEASKKLGRASSHKIKKKLDPPEDNTKKGAASPGNLFPEFPKLGSSFYQQDCINLAKSLLSKVLVRVLDGERLAGRIVETEAYLGIQDSACHSYQGRRTDKNKAMWMAPGTVYVYLIYGMYHCMNISSQEEGSAVLLRALEPLEGAATMEKLRSRRRKSTKEMKQKALCSGPGKLTDALEVTKALFNKESLVTNPAMWVEDGPAIPGGSVVACSRIGIGYASSDWRDKPLRFYIHGSDFVSKRDKVAEQSLPDC